MFSVCPRTPKTLSQLSPFWVFAPILSLFLSLPPAHRPPATLSLRPFYSHEVCIPHLLCRLHTKEQKAPLLTCGKHSSPPGPFTQPESPIVPVASARVCLLSNNTAWRYHQQEGGKGGGGKHGIISLMHSLYNKEWPCIKVVYFKEKMFFRKNVWNAVHTLLFYKHSVIIDPEEHLYNHSSHL